MEREENITNGAKLRRLAEEALEEAPDDRGDLSEFSPEEMTGLIHDLRVHQIELKMQNEEPTVLHIEVGQKGQQRILRESGMDDC
jgi:hypothetical protein